MNLYLIEQDKKHGYDYYDSAVVVAESPETAAAIHPGGDWDNNQHTWCSLQDEVTVTLLGKAVEGSISGVVLASFNAG